MMKQLITLLAPLCLLASCAPNVSRTEAIAIAYSYTQVQWQPEPRHVLHGKDSAGINVDTPDRSLKSHGGWWSPGKPAIGMPYKWGGFDTPSSFRFKIQNGYKAGDIGGASKRRLGDAATSNETAGIDCSGFVSRCWKLSVPYSTKRLSEVSDPLPSWDDLKAGDILLKDGHVLIFKTWSADHKNIIGYEAGPFPVWRVNACSIPKKNLMPLGYKPMRYRWIADF